MCQGEEDGVGKDGKREGEGGESELYSSLICLILNYSGAVAYPACPNHLPGYLGAKCSTCVNKNPWGKSLYKLLSRTLRIRIGFLSFLQYLCYAI